MMNFPQGKMNFKDYLFQVSFILVGDGKEANFNCLIIIIVIN